MDGAGKRGELRALWLAVGMYVLVFALKLGAYLATGVLALLAEALHTLSDIFVSGFLLVALAYSRREADERYAFGYGRAQNVAALVAATLFISFTSYTLYQEAIPRLFVAEAASYRNAELALAVLVGSMLLAAAPLVGLLRQRQRGAAAKAQLMELVNDELGLLAALVGTLLVLAGVPLGDPAAAIAVATIIAVNAVGLFRENMGLLLGRSPGPVFLAGVTAAARSVEGVVGVHELRAEYVGPDRVHLGMHLEVPRGTPVERANRIAAEVRERIHQETPGGYCFIEVDAAPQDGHTTAPPVATVTELVPSR
ncbi:MAG TPA: cation diffusion facilitator family transporter [Chloroflexota bacterium]|nr:cation diffusion facilitator family transporter [Chloroflexota bacterium]